MGGETNFHFIQTIFFQRRTILTFEFHICGIRQQMGGLGFGGKTYLSQLQIFPDSSPGACKTIR